MYARKAARAPPLRSPPNDSRSDSTSNRVKTAPRLYDMKCGATSYGHFGSRGGLPIQVQLRQWPEAVGARASEKGSAAHTLVVAWGEG